MSVYSSGFLTAAGQFLSVCSLPLYWPEQSLNG